MVVEASTGVSSLIIHELKTDLMRASLPYTHKVHKVDVRLGCVRCKTEFAQIPVRNRQTP